ncbi:hypothetical protein B0T25DRAFT_562165 [Lasiosphaeria hispida]|uniref:Uncharacterized protein n=1 Tax=Lasiosphaeria hispida TaxID=260671 RepID=A0AAJ0MJU2_9PEZI|nr:hypothetical protein B0T25DRAFT_562165 [Lasiosphaeria hispida]
MSPFQPLYQIPYPTKDGIIFFHTANQAIYDEWCQADHSFCDMTPATLQSLDSTLPHNCPGAKPSNPISTSILASAQEEHRGHGGAICAILSTVVLIFLLLLCIKWCFCLTASKSVTGEHDSKRRGQNGDTDYVHLEDFGSAEGDTRPRPTDARTDARANTDRDPLLARPAPAIIAPSRRQESH